MATRSPVELGALKQAAFAGSAYLSRALAAASIHGRGPQFRITRTSMETYSDGQLNSDRQRRMLTLPGGSESAVVRAANGLAELPLRTMARQVCSTGRRQERRRGLRHHQARYQSPHRGLLHELFATNQKILRFRVVNFKN